MGVRQSTFANWNDEHLRRRRRATQVFCSPAQTKYLTLCVPLHKAALKGDWKTAENLLDEDPTLVKTPITERGETALHIAAVEGHAYFVTKLLEKMEKSDTEIQNKKECTALCFAAAAGHVEIAKLMIEKNADLPKIGRDSVLPLYMATLLGHDRMAGHLYPVSSFESWSIDNQVALLTTAINSGLYGLAMNIIEKHHDLVLTEDVNGETPLEVLARKPSAFDCGTNQQGFFGSIASTLLLPYMKLKKETLSSDDECDAYTLLGCLWDHVISREDIETTQIVGESKISKLLFIAAESGNDELLVELIRRYPDFLYKVNESNQSIFHIAVLHRYVQSFNLIYELSGVKDLIATYIDVDGNNMLHLAAMLAPQDQLSVIPGAALQMQREVLWYKEVEKMVQPSYRTMKNHNDQTPHDVFLSQHQKLMKEGEKLMKQTAKSCMLVTMLIATVVFTTAFTVPGGYSNDTGAPILEDQKLFMVFPVSEAIATLSSLTSMLMFLSILTSRYAENDFLVSLPFWLVVGVASLFVSIVAMMGAFCTGLLFYNHGHAVIAVLLLFFVSVPVMFSVMKFPLLVTILRSTYGCRWLFRSNDRLFS